MNGVSGNCPFTQRSEMSVTFSEIDIIDAGGLSAFGRERGIAIAHDRRGAPVAMRADGTEDTKLLVSLTDEAELTLCAWTQRRDGSPVLGVGIDLVDLGDFSGERGEFLSGLILTERDRAVAREAWPKQPELGWAFAFSAKEAAFKACAAPLRRWYETHDEELAFDLRGFELADARHAQGSARRGEAGRAMGAMGIARIELCCERRENYLVTCALALE